MLCAPSQEWLLYIKMQRKISYTTSTLINTQIRVYIHIIIQIIQIANYFPIPCHTRCAYMKYNKLFDLFEV